MTIFDEHMRPIRRHKVSAVEGRCTQCGMDLAQCQLEPACDTNSEAAQNYRKELRDGGVGRAIQRG